DFTTSKLNESQTRLFQILMEGCTTIDAAGAKVLIASASCNSYVEGLATLTRRLLDMVVADAAISVVFMRDRIYVVGRSDGRSIDVREMARHFGGDGHPGAASAVVKGRTVSDVVTDCAEWIHRETKPQATASQIMKSPVRTIPADLTMDEAARLMLRFQEDGL